MKANKTLWISCAMLALAAITVPIGLFAQGIDLTAERAEGSGGDVDTPDKADTLDSGDDLAKPAHKWPEGDYVIVNGSSNEPLHLGPTGLWGFPAGMNIWVAKVSPESPADGKVLPGDVIYGTNGKDFPAGRDIRESFAMAITEAETKEAGGKLTLNVRRNGHFGAVPIQLKVMGSYSATTPWDCEKSNNIIKAAKEYLHKGMRPETGLPADHTYIFDPWRDSAFFILATGDPEVQGLLRRHIRDTQKKVDAYKAGSNTAYDAMKGWGTAYTSFLFAEYYHCTGDPSVLPYLEEKGFSRPGEIDSTPTPPWPPTGPTGYLTHPNPQMLTCMRRILADEAGLKINKEQLAFDLKSLYIKRAEHGYVKYFGYSPITIEERQIDAPIEITEENKSQGNFSSQNGKLGTAAALFSMVDGHQKAVDMCSTRCVYAFKNNGGHGGEWFNGFWKPIGAFHAGPEKFKFFMKNQQAWRELFRDHTGAMWETGNAKMRIDTFSTGFATHWALPRQKLRMFGAPRSMFGPDAPAYMKDALAAHRNRDYALAEQLTLKLLASGTVPAADKARVDHFLNSIQTLRKSVDYDLSFIEALINKGNYALANIELPQLQMVASPNNTRLKAIVNKMGSSQAQAHIAAVAAKQKRDSEDSIKFNKEHGFTRDKHKVIFEKDLASTVTLVKDESKYNVMNGRVTIGTYPVYPKTEIHQWSVLPADHISKAPAGWEQPGFDDSKWAKVISKRWPKEPALLMRTNFDVPNVKAFSSLRVRVMTGKNETSNFTLYLNGKLVAKVTNIPRGGTAFHLKPGALAFLKNGKNTLGLSTQRGGNEHRLNVRLEGILNDPAANKATTPPKQPAPPQNNGKR